jgi:hypothetical protein
MEIRVANSLMIVNLDRNPQCSSSKVIRSNRNKQGAVRIIPDTDNGWCSRMIIIL